MRKYSAFPGMASFINTTVGIERVLGRWEDGVELGFLDIGFVAVDSFQSSVAVD